MKALLYLSQFDPSDRSTGAAQRSHAILSMLLERVEVRVAVLGNPPPGLEPHPILDRITSVDYFDPARTYLGINRHEPLWGPLGTRVRHLVFDRMPNALRANWSDAHVDRLCALREQYSLSTAWCYQQVASLLAVEAKFHRVHADLDDLPGETARSLVRTSRFAPSKPFFLVDSLKSERFDRRVAREFYSISLARIDQQARLRHPRSRILSNGVALGNPPVPIHGQLIGFVGSLHYEPNVAGLEWLLTKVWPTIAATNSEARLLIAGRFPDPRILRHASNRVEILANVDDIREVYARCALMIAPIRAGSGTKIKVLESMAMRRAVVATSKALEGIGVTDGVGAIRADTSVEFARGVLGALGNPWLCDSIAARGHNWVVDNGSWESQRAVVHATVDQLLNR